MDPEGKVALITGGASGIGSACAKILLANGAKVAICDRNSNAAKDVMKDISKTFGENKAIFIEMDIQDPNLFEEAFKRTKSQFNGVDIVVNNAGIFDDINWEREIDINLKGTVRGCLLAMRYMGKDKGGNGGVILNISSIAALDCFAAVPIYSATKDAVISLGRSLGQPFHFDRTGVRVLTLCPGTTDTPLMRTCHEYVMDPSWKQLMINKIREHPIGQPEDIAKSFLQMIQGANNGAIWVSEGPETYSVTIPKRQDMREEV